MNDTFLIQHDWLHTEQISQAERATQAEISILVNGTCVTVNEDRLEGTTRQSARLSALHLSEWFATNWWRLLWEPDDGRSTPEWQMVPQHKRRRRRIRMARLVIQQRLEHRAGPFVPNATSRGRTDPLSEKLQRIYLSYKL